MDKTLLTHAELLATGLTPDDITRLRRAGKLHRVCRGVYARHVPEDEEGRHLQLVAACARRHPSALVASHVSAAVIHGLPVRRGALGRASFIRPEGGHAGRSQATFIRALSLQEQEYTTVNGQLVTSLARTVADIARTEPQVWGVAAVDVALRRGIQREEIVAILDADPTRHGTWKARAVVEFGDARAESPLESISRFHMATLGLPAPELQVEFFDEQGDFVARSEFFWRDRSVVGECHGVSKYTTLVAEGSSAESVLRAQLARTARLRALGLHVVEWGWDVAQDQDALGAVLGPALVQGTGRSWPRAGAQAWCRPSSQ